MAKSDRPVYSDDELVAQVTRAETLLEIAPGAPRKFLRFGNWLVESRCFRRFCRDFLAGREVAVFPFFGLRPAYKTWSRLWKNWQAGFRSSMAADLICVRNNVRCFYLAGEEPFTVKFPRTHNPDNALRYQREIAARRRVEAIGILRVPKLLQTGPEDFHFLVEEIVEGHLPSVTHDRETLLAWLAGPLREHYFRQGFTFRPATSALSVGVLRHACDAVPWKPEWLPKEEFLTAAARRLESGGEVVFIDGHGDLSPANLLLIGAGTLCVVDWETAGEILLVQDLFAFVEKLPGADEIARRWFAEVSASHPAEVMDFDGQLLVFYLQRVLKRTGHLKADVFMGYANEILRNAP